MSETRTIKTALSDNPELNELMKKAKAAFDALTPEQKRAHRREQAISWVFGEMMLARYERGQAMLTKEEQEEAKKRIGDLYDEKHGTWDD